jgi:hypothetical protein
MRSAEMRMEYVVVYHKLRQVSLTRRATEKFKSVPCRSKGGTWNVVKIGKKLAGEVQYGSNNLCVGKMKKT